MSDFKKIFAHKNRGWLLDVVVFFFQLILLLILTRLFADLLRQAKADIFAQVAVILFCLGLAFLQPIGALLKRRRGGRLSDPRSRSRHLRGERRTAAAPG